MIQNQSRRFPKKWDKSGVIFEIKNNDQYLVKVDGSSRLTLRNRWFLRKYKSHGGSRHAQISNVHVNNFVCTTSCEDTTLTDENFNGGGTSRSRMQEPPSSDYCPASPQCPPASPECPPLSPQCTHPFLLHVWHLQTPVAEPQEQQYLRPRREKRQRKVYDLSTGKSVTPQAVPEEV